MARRVSETPTRPTILIGRYTITTIRLLKWGCGWAGLTISNLMRFHSSAYTYTASSTVFQNDVEMQILGRNSRWASWKVLPRASDDVAL